MTWLAAGASLCISAVVEVHCVTFPCSRRQNLLTAPVVAGAAALDGTPTNSATITTATPTTTRFQCRFMRSPSRCGEVPPGGRPHVLVGYRRAQNHSNGALTLDLVFAMARQRGRGSSARYSG